MNTSNGPVRRLPDNLQPKLDLCLKMKISSDPQWLAAFYDALFQLTYWFAWDRDNAHSGRIVAAHWLKALDTLQIKPCADFEQAALTICEDELNLRISPDDPCIIQQWCIDHWEDWYDPTSCGPSSVSQPDPRSQGAVGSCDEIDVLLTGSDIYHLPMPVSGGDTIEISATGGGWWDGAVGPWNCPDGRSFVLGGCTGSGGLAGGDPAPTVHHMRLIAHYNAVYLDAYNLTITIPTGLAATELYFQANDGTLSDNKGSIHFHLKVCHNDTPPPSDCLESDFSISAQGWTTIDGTATFGSYDSGGHYWLSNYVDAGGGVHYDQLRIKHAYVGHIASIKVVYSAAQDCYLAASRDGTEPSSGPALFSIFCPTGVNQTREIALDSTATNHVRLDLSRDGDAANLALKIHSVEICP